MRKDIVLILATVGLLAAIGVVGIVAGSRSIGNKMGPSYSADDPERPSIQLSESSFDMGAMKVTEVKSRDLTLVNSGKSPLVLTDFATSCDCTFAEVTIDGVKSPRFTMHGTNTWQGTIEPGKSATLSVIYEPSRMPVQGLVERSISFVTNDPVNTNISVSFAATVE